MFGNKDKKYIDVLNWTINELKTILEDIKEKKILSKGEVRDRFISIREVVYKNHSVTKKSELEERINLVTQAFNAGAFSSTEECYDSLHQLINSLTREVELKKVS